jgi:WD40 repeat protein
MRRVASWILVLCLAPSCVAADVPEKPILVLDSGGHTGSIRKLLFTPDGKQLISVSDDNTIRAWDVTSGAPLRVLRPPINSATGGKLFAAALTPDGQTLAAGGWAWNRGEIPIYLIDLATGRILRTLEGHKSSIQSLAFSSDGTHLASGSNDRTSRIWNVASGRCERVLEGHENIVDGVAFAPGSQRLATASTDKTGRIWSLANGRCEAVLRGHEKEVRCVAWRPDGKVVATGGLDGNIRQWSPDGTAFRGFDKLGGQIYALAFSSSSQALLFATGSPHPCFASLLNLTTGTEQVRFGLHTNSILDCALSPDGALAATTGGDANETFLWRLPDASVVRRLAGRGRKVFAVASGHDSEFLVWGNTSKVVSFNDRGPLERTFRLADLDLSDGVSSDPRRAISTLGTLRLEMLGAALAVKEGPDIVSTIKLAQSHDRILSFTLLPGERVAVGSDFGLYLFDARSGKTLHEFMGHSGAIWAVAASPDGRYLLSGSGDQTVRIWDLAGIESEIATNKRAGIGCRVAVEGEFRIVKRITPGLPLSREQGIRLGDRIIAVAKEGEDFVELKGNTIGEYAGMFRGVAGTRIRLRTSREGVDGTSDFELKLEDLPVGTSTPLISVFVAGDEWVAWSPTGYYAASPGGEQLMGWHVNNGPEEMASFYPASQFRKTLYRPDVIKRLIGAGSLRKALTEANAASGTSTQETDVAQILPPKVNITSPTEPKINLNGNTLEIKALATSVGEHAVTTLRLLIDGRPAPEGLKTFTEPKLGEVRASWTVEVPPGSHRLTVQASNAVSKAVSDAVEVVTVDNANPAAPSSSLYVLAVGINDYPDKRLKLDCAAPDAQSFRQAFVTNSSKLFRAIEVKLLLNGEATRANILDGLQWLGGKAKPGDVVVVFYAGHGDCKIEDQFYLVPVDANLRNLSGTGISGETLKRALADLPSTTMLVLDACYAGSFDGKKRKKRGLPEQSDALMRDLTFDAGLVVMCGASKEQEAAEEDGHGFFTQALVEGLSGKADLDKDGVIEVDELDVYVTRRVRKLSANEQEPTISRPSVVRSFALSKP